MSSVALAPREQQAMPSLSESASIAHKLAWRMVQVNANIQKIMCLFSENAVILVGSHNPMNRNEFEQALIKGSVNNITAIGEWEDSFEPSQQDLNGVVWKVKGVQHRLGVGFQESGPGWYSMNQTIELRLVEENGKMKISSFESTHYEKIKLPESTQVKALSLGQALIHELAYRSLNLPQGIEKLIELYSKNAEIITCKGDSLNVYDIAEIAEVSECYNMLKMNFLSNTYKPVEGDDNKVEWISRGSQLQYSNQTDECVKGPYDMRQVADFSFVEESGKQKIALQNNKELERKLSEAVEQ